MSRRSIAPILVIAAVLASGTLFPVASAAEKKSPAKKASPKTPAVPAKPNPPPAQPVAPAPLPDLLASIPEDGSLSRRDLILMAFRGSPRIWRFHGEAAYFTEAEKAAYDWRDPELRLGYSHEFEAEVERPFTEHRSIATSESGVETRQESGSRTEINGPDAVVHGSFSDSRRRVTRGSTQEEIERRVIPGKYRDVIEETVYEVERSRLKEDRRQRSINGDRVSEGSTEDRRRRVISRTREIRDHPNDLYPDESYSITLRIYIPNPMMMKAAAAKARAERGLADAEMRKEMRDVAMDVNRWFDEMQYWHLWRRQDEKLVELMERNLSATEEMVQKLGQIQVPGVGNLVDPAEVPRARMEIVKAEEELFDSTHKFMDSRSELAQLAGLSDASRITLTNRVVLRRIELQNLDAAALIELARANRPELAELRARSDIARAELREVKARRIPWFNDVRAGYTQNILDGYRDQDEVTALLTLNLPFFSWWQTKDHRMHETIIREYEKARLGLTYGIEGQVNHALGLLREISKQLDRHDAHRARFREFAKLSEAEAGAAGDKAARIRIASDEEAIKLERGRIQWVYEYNETVNDLEAALGIPLAEAFTEASIPSK